MRQALLLTAVAFALIIGCAERNEIAPIVVENSTFELLSMTQTPGWANDVWVSGDTAYIADDEQGVSYFDISDQNNPQYLLSFPLALPGDRALQVIKTNDDGHSILFVIGRTSGLNLYDPTSTEYSGNFGSSIISDVDIEVIQTDSLHIGVADYIDDGYGIRRMGYNTGFGFWQSTQNFFAAGYWAFCGNCIDEKTPDPAPNPVGLCFF